LNYATYFGLPSVRYMSFAPDAPNAYQHCQLYPLDISSILVRKLIFPAT